MNFELFKAFHASYSRAQRSNQHYYVIPHRDKVFISTSAYSINDNTLFYIVKSSGSITKYNNGLIFNVGPLDNLKAGDYV